MVQGRFVGSARFWLGPGLGGARFLGSAGLLGSARFLDRPRGPCAGVVPVGLAPEDR